MASEALEQQQRQTAALEHLTGAQYTQEKVLQLVNASLASVAWTLIKGIKVGWTYEQSAG